MGNFIGVSQHEGQYIYKVILYTNVNQPGVLLVQLQEILQV